MARYRTFDEEMQHLRNLLDTVSSDEENLEEDNDFPENEEPDDEEYFSNHDSSTEIESDSENDVSDSSTDDYFIGRDNATKWNKEKFRANVRISAKNIVSKLPGNTPFSKNVTSPVDAWNLLISYDMMKKLVQWTNIFIDSIRERFSRERDAKETNEAEMKAFIGLLYLIGLHKSSHVYIRDLWATDGTGIEIFRTTMSSTRFYFLLRCLRFDDIQTRQSRKELDKLAPIREFFEKFVENCQKAYNVGEYVTIDEKLESFRGRCPFRQYMPKKPSKYGIKIFALVDSRVFYTWKMEIYAGKQPNGPFQVDNSPSSVVKRLMEPLYNSGRNLTVDNWYTSYPLSQELLQKKITIVGTLRKNKREIPPIFLNSRKRDVYSSTFGFQKETTIVSYIPKKNRNVLLLSTMHNDNAIDLSTGEAKKPEIITFYNMTKGAVDVVDEMAATYSTAKKTNRWPMAVFYAMLNVAAINSRVLLLSTKEPPAQNRPRRSFLKSLGFNLIEDYQKIRSQQTMLPQSLKAKLVKEEDFQPSAKKAKVTYKRCAECGSKKDRKTKFVCEKCLKPVCMEHMACICKKCTE
ncbi:PiggyBac transposable element-derived protein 4 [Araneus ventricosus]|uniref:PiggyBac transposable element-derived protein 4 n=1 Tax=Araneus ventricosus TaxID=182803 RepID=A0A4Y2PMT9_ARAVE|nr:PiggyBac transposable element-derived protein 4 [Araneus ventricosus]